jgi:hypothetical protein
MDRITLDQGTIYAIGALFTMATGGVGWLVKTLWAERTEAFEKLLAVMQLQFEESTRRRDLWENLGKLVIHNGQEIEDVKRIVGEINLELRRRGAA